MIRLIKLAIYLIAGYALYEFVLGLTEERAAGGGFESSPSGQKPRRAQSGTGAKVGGKRVPIADGTGAERTQAVGRGVMS